MRDPKRESILSSWQGSIARVRIWRSHWERAPGALVHCLNYMRHMVVLFCYKDWFGLATEGNWYFFLSTGFIFSFAWHIWTNQLRWYHGPQIALAYILKMILLENSSYVSVSGKCIFSLSKTLLDCNELRVFLSENLKYSIPSYLAAVFIVLYQFEVCPWNDVGE